jgi:hypothetical protein
MEANPNKTPPWIEKRIQAQSLASSSFTPDTPYHTVEEEHPLKLGIDFEEELTVKERNRGPDGKFAKKE